MILTVKDPILGTIINYKADDVFIVEVRNYYNKRLPTKVFKAKHIDQAFRFYHELDLPKTSMKYLVRHDPTELTYEDIYKSKGNLDKNTIKLVKSVTTEVDYEKSERTLLYNMPKKLHEEFQDFDSSFLPFLGSRFTKNTLAFALLAKFFDSSEDERKDMILGCLDSLDKYKKMSGCEILQDSKVEVMNDSVEITDGSGTTLKDYLGDTDLL